MRSGAFAIMSRTRWSPARLMSGPMSMITSRSSRAAWSPAYLIAMRPPIECPTSVKRRELQAARERGHVVGHRADAIVVVGRGVAVAVPALVEGEHPAPGQEPLGQVVPHPRVPGDAVQQHHRRGLGRPPVEIVQRDAVDLDGALGEGHDGQSSPGVASVNPARLAYPGALTVE